MIITAGFYCSSNSTANIINPHYFATAVRLRDCVHSLYCACSFITRSVRNYVSWQVDTKADKRLERVSKRAAAVAAIKTIRVLSLSLTEL